MKFALAPLLSSVLFFCAAVPLTQASAADSTHYAFPFEGFSIDLSKDWVPESKPEDMAALRNWNMGDSHLEIYTIRSKQAKNLHRYIAKDDKASSKLCNGKPAETFLRSESLRINGYRAVERYVRSCVTGGDFYVTRITDGNRIAEITMNKPTDATQTGYISFTDGKGNYTGGTPTYNGHSLTDADAAIYKQILDTFHFLPETKSR